MYNGQFMDDKIIEGYFKSDYIGNCIDIGASDGISGNNTKYFEDMGWNCLCVEPNPNYYNKLKSIRKNTLNLAISNTNDDSIDFTIVSINDDNESAASALRVDERLIKLHEDMGYSITRTPIKVSTRTLDYCIENYYSVDKIDFLSIDTEGTELDVLKGFDINKWNPTLIVVENNYEDTEIEYYLNSFNYVKDKRVSVNDFYIKRRSFLIGPNLGDFFHALYAVKCVSGISNSDVYIGGNFPNDIHEVYNDIYSKVMSQPYINKFLIYDGLTPISNSMLNFRQSKKLYTTHWYDIYQSMFNIKNKYENEPWLYNLDNDDFKSYSDTVIIHFSKKRYHHIYDEVLKDVLLNNKCLFISSDESEYQNFKFKSLVEFKKCTFSELYSIINNCKFFVGNQSMPLALAHGLYKSHLGFLFGVDSIHYEDSINPNYFWINSNRRCSQNFNEMKTIIQLKNEYIIPQSKPKLLEPELLKCKFDIRYDSESDLIFISCNSTTAALIKIYDIRDGVEILSYYTITEFDCNEFWYKLGHIKFSQLSSFKVEILLDENIFQEKTIKIN
jgi:FkbM family methyltransferase